MGYVVGIDLGTTYSAAAVGRDGRVEIATLGTRAASIPSVIVVQPHGELLVGEAAERRALAEPARAAREFKRRLGDPVPMLVAGEPRTPEWLMAELLRWIVERVAELEGGPPDRIVVTHPANWGPYKTDRLREALDAVDPGPVELLTEPEAAAVHYAGSERVDDGSVVAVYDLGGGTFDAAVVRKTPEGFALTGTPEGMERFGGIDVDHAVVVHVQESLGGLLDDADPTDPATAAGLARLRDECRQAKEALSEDTDVAIPVVLPGVQTEVRLTRAELEAMVRPRLQETVEALERTVRSAGVGLDDLASIVLVGGASRMPLVADVVRAGTGRPVAVDAHPKHAIALGAARVALAGVPAAPAPPVAAPTAAAAPAAGAAAPARGRSRVLVVLAAFVVVAALVGGALFLLGDDDAEPVADPAAQETTTTTADAEPPPPATEPDAPEPEPEPQDEAYPPGATAEFVEFCLNQGVPADTCGCVEEGMPGLRSYEEFTAFEQELYADPGMELPVDVARLFERCAGDA